MNNTTVLQKDKEEKSAPPLIKPTTNELYTPIEAQKSQTLSTLKPQAQTCNTKNTLPSFNTIDISHSSSNLSSLQTNTDKNKNKNTPCNTNLNNTNCTHGNKNTNDIISLLSPAQSIPKPSQNNIPFNGHSNHPTNIDLNDMNGMMNGNNALFKSPDHLNNLMKKFGRPTTMSEFNIMAIAGVLQEGNHIHKNRELKATVKRFQQQMGEQQEQIKLLNEKVKIYKDEAEKYERLEIKYNQVMQLNVNLVSHNKSSKTEITKLKEKMRKRTNTAKFQIHYPNTNNNHIESDIDLVQPLPVDDHDNDNDILAPDHNHNHNHNNNNQIEDKSDAEPEQEQKHASSWLRNQRLIQLTGDQTYMTAHQKVIKDPNQKKLHQTYQRKESFKSIQAENKALKDQIVQITKELEEARALQGGLTEDGLTADYLKTQLSKVRDELEQEKKITSKFKVAMHCSDDLQTVKMSLANSQSELERLKIRYEKSKQRVENLASETEIAKKVKDKVMKERDEVKEKTKNMISNARDHIVKISNECEMYKKEVLRLTRENKKLLQRESLEEELNVELGKLKKQCKQTESQCKKHKKRYKDLKLQADTSGMVIRSKRGRKRGRGKKNEVFLSSDSEEKVRVEKTVKLIKKWEKKQKKEKKFKVKRIRIRTDDILKDIDNAIETTNAQVNDDNVVVDNNEDEIGWSSDDNEVICNNGGGGGGEIIPTYLAPPPPMTMAVGGGIVLPPVGIPVHVSVPVPVPMPVSVAVVEERIGSPTAGVMGYGSASPQMLPVQSNVEMEMENMDNGIKCEENMNMNLDDNVEETQERVNTDKVVDNNVSKVTDNFEHVETIDVNTVNDDLEERENENSFVNDVNNVNDNDGDGDDEDDGSDFVDHDLAEISTVNDLFISQHNSNDNNQINQLNTPNTDDDAESMFNMGSGIDSPCQNPIVSSSQTNPFNNVAAPLMLNDSAADDHDEDIQQNEPQIQQVQPQQRDNTDTSSWNNTNTNNNNNNNNNTGPQPLYTFEGVTSDSSDADHSDPSNPNFQSPIQCQPEPLFTDHQMDNRNNKLFNNDQPTQMPEPNQEVDEDENDDYIKQETQTVFTPKEESISFELEVGLKSDDKLHNDDNDNSNNINKIENDDNYTNQKQPGNINDNNIKCEPHNNNNGMDDDDINNKKRPRNIIDDNIITEPLSKKRKLINNNNENNLPNLEKTFTVNSNPFAFNKRNNINNISPNYSTNSSTQFINWKEEFSHLITQKTSSLIDSCINNILQRWKNPQCECDKRNSCKVIAEGILDIIVLQKFDVICPNGYNFFAAHNKNTYLSLLTLLCDIITKLNNKTLMIEILKCCKKIINKKMYPDLKNRSIIYLICGLLSILCKYLKDEGRFWRQILGMMTQFELHFCADIFCIMFECYPLQICAHKQAFVMNCFKYIFLSHSHPILTNNNINSEIIKVKECYRRLTNVVNGKWNYILSSSRDDILVAQLNEYISNGYLDADKSGDTFNGITMICGCDIRYAINHFLPNILYPILYKQFENKNMNPKCVVFLLDLYFECINRVYKRLRKCNQSTKSQCDVIRSDISLIMESILILSIHINNNTPVPIEITLCCLNNLFKIKTKDYIQDILFTNVYCDQQLLTFVTKIFSEWMQRINTNLITQSDKHREQAFFNAFMSITSNVFKRKAYNIQAFQSLKTQYTISYLKVSK